MKKGNEKGFTLIELLAVIIILGVLMLLAVPSVSKFIERGRMNTYKSSVSSMVSAVTNEVNFMSSEYTFGTNEYLVVPFSCIDLERGDNTSSPFGEYNKANSAVIVKHNETNGYDYYVSAKDVNGYGTHFVSADAITISALGTERLPITITYDGTTYSVANVSSEFTSLQPVIKCSSFSLS